MLERPTGIPRVVRGDPKFGAVGEQVRQDREIGRPDEAPFGMSRLGPWIREQQERPGDGGFRQARQQETGVVIEDSNIRKSEPFDMAEQRGDPVNEHLRTDEADLGMAASLLSQMLAVAKADLQPHRAWAVRKERHGIDRVGLEWRGNPQAREKLGEEVLTVRCQPPAVPSTVPVWPTAFRCSGHRTTAQPMP